MAIVTTSNKACSVNPLKMSQPIGGSFAFLGLRGAMPLLHGPQGCTSFGLTLFVRHFNEAVPMQTTAMSEVATVLGGHGISNRRSSTSTTASSPRSLASIRLASPRPTAMTSKPSSG